MAKFNEGDRVRLKTKDSPEMSVGYYDDYNNVVCNWFDKLEVKTFSFNENQLELVE